MIFYAINVVANCDEQVSGWLFDWDDNIMFMPTKVILYDKYSDETLKISTHEFALNGQFIGAEGKYKNYELRKTDKENSFKYFRDDQNGENNYFLNDIKSTVNSSDNNWKGPVWDEFIYALNNKKSADWTVILTARGHSAESIYNGLKYLQQEGVIKYLPKLNNIYAVSHEKYDYYKASTSVKKVKIMAEILDKIEQCQFVKSDITNVIDQDGNYERPLNVWGFSDDDIKNIIAARDYLSTEVANGRWSNIKISLLFTGNSDNNKIPYTSIIKSDGTSRLPTFSELLDKYRLSKN